MVKRYVFSALLILSILSFFSCSKKNAADNPVITITSPLDAQVFDLPLTIDMKYNVEAKHKLRTVSVKVVDGYGLFLHAVSHNNISGNSYTGDDKYEPIIDSMQKVYVMVDAEDVNANHSRTQVLISLRK